MGAPLPQLTWAEQRGLQAQPKSPQHCLETPVQPPHRGWVALRVLPPLPALTMGSTEPRSEAMGTGLQPPYVFFDSTATTCSSSLAPAPRETCGAQQSPVAHRAQSWASTAGGGSKLCALPSSAGPGAPGSCHPPAAHSAVCPCPARSLRTHSLVPARRSCSPHEPQVWGRQRGCPRGGPIGLAPPGAMGCPCAMGNPQPPRGCTARGVQVAAVQGEIGLKGSRAAGMESWGGTRGGCCCCSPHRAVTGLSSDSELETKEELILCSWSSPGSWLL